MRAHANIHLTAKEARQLAKLLGRYQAELEAAIESELHGDGSIPPSRVAVVANLRLSQRTAEKWAARLTGGKP